MEDLSKQIYKNKNFLYFYKKDNCENVEILMIGEMPYPGLWQFRIKNSEYSNLKDFFNLLDNALKQKEWETRGYSISCEWNELYDEVKNIYKDWTINELEEVKKFIENHNN